MRAMHVITITYDFPRLRVEQVERETKEAADFEYQRGVSLVNRDAAKSVLWTKPDGKTYKKWSR